MHLDPCQLPLQLQIGKMLSAKARRRPAVVHIVNLIGVLTAIAKASAS